MYKSHQGQHVNFCVNICQRMSMLYCFIVIKLYSCFESELYPVSIPATSVLACIAGIMGSGKGEQEKVKEEKGTGEKECQQLRPPSIDFCPTVSVNPIMLSVNNCLFTYQSKSGMHQAPKVAWIFLVK